MKSRSQISIQDFSEVGIPLILNYWYGSPPGFLESLGVDVSKFPTQQEMKKALSSPATRERTLLISCDDQLIGFHTLTSVVIGDQGVFHAHIIDLANRRKGIGSVSYPLACEIFMERFQLQRIIFKTPVTNRGAIRVKEKLGIRAIGEDVASSSLLRDGTPLRVFELRRDELSEILPDAH